MKIKKTRMDNKVREEDSGRRREERENSKKETKRTAKEEERRKAANIFTAGTTGGLCDFPIKLL